jgi:serine/threonine protein kinase
MSPEAVMHPQGAIALDQGPKADIWAFAVLLLELLCGRLPWVGSLALLLVFILTRQTNAKTPNDIFSRLTNLFIVPRSSAPLVSIEPEDGE